MNKKIEEYKKKVKKIERTIITLALMVFLLGVLISIVQYGIKKSKANKEKQNSSNGEYSINLNNDAIIYENNLNFNLKISNFNNESKYRAIIKVNDETVKEENIMYEENTFSLEFKDEGKKIIYITLYKDSTECGNFERNVYYVEPYQSQFLDQLSNKGVSCHYKDGTWEKYRKSSELNNNLGTNYLRIEFVWNVIDKNNGTYDFSGYDSYLTNTNKKIVGIFNEQKAGYLAGNDLKINTEDELNQFIEFVEEVAKKYPFIKYYQILNEPNYSNSNGAYMSDEDIKWYEEVIKRTYKKLKSIDNSIQVITGATAVSLNDGNTYISSENFFKEINTEVYGYSSGYAYHPYDIYNNKIQNQVFLKKIDIHNKLFNTFGGFTKQYITEYGIPSYNQYNVNEEIQADKLIQQTVILDEQSAEVALIYNLWNIGKDTTNKEHNYGLINNNYTPKLSYYAMKNYYQNTNGSEYIGNLNIKQGLETHVYNKDGTPLIIAWSDNTDNTYNISLNNMTAKDIYGKDIQPDETGKITITTSPVYLYNISTKSFYRAISNTSIPKYEEFETNFQNEITKVPGLQSSINTLKQRMQNISEVSSLDETTAINLMKQHYNLGNAIIQSYKSKALQIEYVTLSSMLDALNDIGNSYEDLVTVSTKTRNANLTETQKLITEAETLTNDTELEMIYPNKILQFSQDYYEKADYINSLKEENDIKTGLIISKNLHSKLLADWAIQFANLYIDEYITNNPVEITYTTTTLTNQNVTATLKTNANITITNNSNSKTHTFENNGSFTFEYRVKGRAFKKTVEVNNIDKKAPTIIGVQNNKLYIQNITPKIQDENLKQVLLYKDLELIPDYKINSTISEEGSYKLIAEDKVGNQTTVEFDICKNPATIKYSAEQLTNQDVIVTLDSKYEIEETNNENKTTYTFTENGEFTFKFKIKGTELRLTAHVNNIDKIPPTITGAENGKLYIDNATPIIQDENLKEIKLYLNSYEVENYTTGVQLSEEGFYKIIATDNAGNETTTEFAIMESMDKEYKIRDNYILNIKNNTNRYNFDKNLNLPIKYEIIRNETKLTETDKIATGDILVTDGGEEYTLIVNGDINKDGDVNIKDVMKLRRYLLKRNNLDEISLLAADCDLDGKSINTRDLIKMRLIVLERDII